jgi:hypothetical protein
LQENNIIDHKNETIYCKDFEAIENNDVQDFKTTNNTSVIQDTNNNIIQDNNNNNVLTNDNSNNDIVDNNNIIKELVDSIVNNVVDNIEFSENQHKKEISQENNIIPCVNSSSSINNIISEFVYVDSGIDDYFWDDIVFVELNPADL